VITRNILNRLQQELTQPEILILLGPRQVGKTTLLRVLEDYARQKGLRVAFFDLEQPQVLADFNRSDKEIVQMISQAGEIVFIDEFQYVRNISKILKAIFDSRKKIKT
jgi:predicted AAA+ superfamily ATPase